MTNKKLLLLAAAVVLMFGWVASSKINAAEPAKRLGARGPMLQRLISELQLTDEQLTKIKSELRSEKEMILPLLEKLHATRKGLRETIQAGGEEVAIRAAHAKVAAVEADLAVVRAKLHGKIAPILSDEQLVKAKEFEQKVDEFAINAIKSIGERLGQN